MKKFSTKSKILFGLVLIFLVAGCGLKGNPVPSMTVVSQSQERQKLTASAAENAVMLTWQLQDATGKISYITIEKSILGSTGNICRDCPRVFEKIAQFSVKKDHQDYRLSDASVEKGKIYSYRLKLCDEAGVCRESQTVEIDFK